MSGFFSHSHIVIFNDELHLREGDHYRSNYNWGKFILAISPYFKRASYAVPVKNSNAASGTIIEGKNVTFIPLPCWHSMASFLIRLPMLFFPLRSIIKDTLKDADMVYLRFPSLAGFLFFFYAKKQKKPVFVYIGGNVITQANPVLEGPLVTRSIAGLLARGIHLTTRSVVNHSLLTFVKGNELTDLYKGKDNRVVPFITSQINKSLILNMRKDTCGGKPIKMIRVCKVIPSKGLEYIIGAIPLLIKEGYDVILEIVGRADRKEYERQLKALAADHQVGARVIFHGYVPFGEGLFQGYRNADIAVISSLSEGSPRTILESWSFGLPLVATMVGGIPDIVKHRENGLLVSPKSAQAIYQAVKKIIDDQTLRKKLIRNGLKFAENHTEEEQILSMLKSMEHSIALHPT